MAVGFPPQPVYPYGIDSDYTLFKVYNTSEAELTSDNDPWSENVDIEPRSASEAEIWGDNGFANINGELFYYDAVEKDGNGKIFRLKRCARNLGGVPTQFNASGTMVRGFVIAEQHNQIVDSIILTERFIGENFSENEETLDWRIRHLNLVPIIEDDYGCPDVQFDFQIVTDDPSAGTVAHYKIDIKGTYNEFILDFGDGTSTFSPQEGDHTYAPNAKIDPVITLKSNRCQTVQTPVERDFVDTPKDAPPPIQFDFPNFPNFVFPDINIAAPVFPETDLTLPAFQFPCINLPNFSIPPINLPSIILFEPAINLPSLITFTDVNIPSFVEAIGFDLPSIISIMIPDISVIIPSITIPGQISVIVPTFPSISLIVPPFPSISVVVPTFPVISVVFPPTPTISITGLTVASGSISVVFPPTMPTINVSYGTAPNININYGSTPNFGVTYGTMPNFGVIFPVIPSLSITGIASVSLIIPSSATINVSFPATTLNVVFASAPLLEVDWASAPLLEVDWASAPLLEVDWASAPLLAVDWSSAPTLAVDWSSIPTLAVDWSTAPTLTFDWSGAPTFTMDWGTAPAVNINWGEPPTVQVNLTVTCPSSPLALTDPLGLHENTFGKDLEISYDLSGFPSEIKMLPPNIPDIKIIHDIPSIIPIRAEFPDIKLEVPEFKDIRILPPDKPLTIEAIGIPDSIELRSSIVIPDTIELVTEIKHIKIDASDIPDIIRIEGLPDLIRIEHDIPKFIELRMPEKPEVDMVYKGPPIPVHITFDALKEGDSEDYPCFTMIPCRRGK